MKIYLIFDLISVNNKYSPWDWNQSGIKLAADYILYQKLPNFMYKKDIHVNRLDISSLACKCVFYRTKQNAMGRLNFEGLEMQK